MKLQTEVSELVLSNVGATSDFKIRNSAKAFKILSDGLYSNKIRAIVRELSCNAIDSHVAAGKADIPIEVHLPTVFESWFSVKDFGIGLNHEEVSNIYTTYFESTKTESNDFIGALGLGSKSPFSYTENFTVIAIKDGVKRIYSAFINQQGVPSVALMSEDATEEGNGVEVKFSVTNRNDYHTFEYEAKSVFSWFKNTPKITGSQTTIDRINYEEKDILPGIHRLSSNFGSHAIMGNIAYPIRVSQETRQSLGDLARMLECSLAIEFDIGDLDFTASREELSYIPLTVNSIKKKLESLSAHLETHIEEKSQQYNCEWQKAEYFYSLWQDRLYSSAVKSYTKRINFKFIDETQYGGRYNFTFDVKDIPKIQILAFSHNHGTNTSLKAGSRYCKTTGKRFECWSISLSSKVILILNDLKVGCYSRARHEWVKQKYDAVKNGQQIFCVSVPEIKDIEEKKEFLKKFQESYLPGCPNIIWASSLPAPAPKKKEAVSGILEYRYDTHGGTNWAESEIKTTDDIDESITYYYVNLSNFKTMSEDREKEIDIEQALSNIRTIYGYSLPFKLYGIRKNAESSLKEFDNFVWVEDKIRDIVSNITEEKVRDAYAISAFSYRSIEFFRQVLKSNKLTNTKLFEFAKKYEKSLKEPRSDTKALCMKSLANAYGRTLSVDHIQKEIEKDIKDIGDRYPMLQYVYESYYNYDMKHVLDYVNLIDEQEK